LALYYFGSLYPQRNSLNHTWTVASVAAGSIPLVATVPWLEPANLAGTAETMILRAWTVFTALVYTAVFVHVARPIWTGESSTDQRFGSLALTIVTTPAGARALRRLGRFTERILGIPVADTVEGMPRLAPLAALVLVTAGLALYAHRRAPKPHRRLLVGGIVVFGGLLVIRGPATRLFHGLRIAGAVSGPRPSWLPPARIGAAVRWSSFGVLRRARRCAAACSA